MTKYTVSGKDCENTSSHVKISAFILTQFEMPSMSSQLKTNKTTKKLQWEKIDKHRYTSVLEKELKKLESKDIPSVDHKLQGLIEVIHTATAKAVPSKITKLKGPTWKASPKVRNLLLNCKDKYKKWVGSGKSDNILRKDNIMAKRELRKQLRKEKIIDRRNFYGELMQNPTTEKFYQLIRRNNGNKGQRTGSLIVNGEEIFSATEQRLAFSKYYEDLSIPKDHGYDSAYLELCSVRHEMIAEICRENPSEPDPITVEEVTKAIHQLNNKKAADEFGLTAEHLKYSGYPLIENITNIFNETLKSKTIPAAFKSGILTPVLKKSKDSTNLDNYRGITVTPIIGKLFESVLLPRLSETFDQSPLQFGFTKGLSPIMSALIVSEARAEVKVNSCAPLFLVTLDSRKAFDVVNHIIMLDKLYESGIHPTLWTIVKDLYTGLTSKVKWIGELSKEFNICQGVRQGAILSPFLYKTYINPCLIELKQHRLGLFIGGTYCGCPTCADDLALISDCENELQVMTNVVKRHAKKDHVTIHPDKSNVVLLNQHKSVSKKSFSLELDGKSMPLSQNTTHLGILRSETNENVINIEDRLKLARRTLYALINTGVHGSNGLNPNVSFKMYQCYVLPRLLFGLEALPITNSQLAMLSKFHVETLKRCQSLPLRTATCAVYLLIGALPIEAELHKRHLSLLHNIMVTSNETITELTKRQIAINLDNSLSYYHRVQDILDLYQLPSLRNLQQGIPSKEQWKFTVKQAVNTYWSEKLKTESNEKSTLTFLNKDILKIGQTHPLWSTLESTVSDVRKGITKGRMPTGTYLLQTSQHKFSRSTISAACKCCGLNDEDLPHMLLECPALLNQRKLFYPRIKQLVISNIGIIKWKELFNNRESIVRLVLDCSSFTEILGKSVQIEIQRISTELCHRLHLTRLNKLG